MKIKSGFVLREIAGEWMAIAVGTRTADFSNMIVLSETAAYVWKLLKEEKTVENLAEALATEFDVDYETAKRDAEGFGKVLAEKGLLDNE